MGQQFGKDSEAVKEQFFSRYSFLEEKEDNHYGSIKIFERSANQSGKGEEKYYMNSKTLAVKETTFQDVESMDAQMKKMKQLCAMAYANHTDNKTSNIVDVYEYFVTSEDKFCSSIQRLQLVLEYLQRDLQLEIKTKKLQNQRFTPQEIFTIAFSCIHALSKMQIANITHQDLTASNILVSEYFQIKILHPTLNNTIPRFTALIAQLNSKDDTDTYKGVYLSPILAKAVVAHQYSPAHNPFKSDVFTLGVILMECCNLGSPEKIFDYDAGEIKENELRAQLQLINNSYGVDVHDLISRMVKLKEEERMDFIELNNLFGVANKMNEVHAQQQLLISQQTQFKQNFQDQAGVSLFRAMNTESDEDYNYSKPPQFNGQPVPVGNNDPVVNQQAQFGGYEQQKQQPQQIQNYQPTVQQSQQQQRPQQILPQFAQQGQTGFIQNSVDPFMQSTFSFQNKIDTQQSSVSTLNPNPPALSSNTDTIKNNPGIYGQTTIPGQNSHPPRDTLPQQNLNQNISNLNSAASTASFYGNQQSYGNNQFSNNPLLSRNSNIVNPQLQTNPVMFQNATFGNQYGQLNPNQFQPQQQTTLLPPYQALNMQNPNVLSQEQLLIQNAVLGQQSQIQQAPLTSQQGQNQPPLDGVQKIMQDIKEKQVKNDQLYMEKERNLLAQSQKLQPNLPGNQQQSPLPSIQRNSSLSNLTPSPININPALQQYKQLDTVLSQQLPLSQYQQAAQQPGNQPIQGYLNQNQVQYNQFQNQQQVMGPLNTGNSNYSGHNISSQSSQRQQQDNLPQFLPKANEIPQNQGNNFIRIESQHQQDYNSEALMFSGTSSSCKYQYYYIYLLCLPFPVTSERVPTEAYSTSRIEHIQETYDDQSYYIGEKLGGLRHGNGKFYYADGGYYEGDWREGRMEGLGTLYYPSGSLAYLGQWKNDQFNGKGTVYNESPSQVTGIFDFKNFDKLGEYWVKYEGEFIDDNKEGTGTIYLSNGDRFTGSFNNDFVHGQGTYFRDQQEPVKGVWDCNHLVQYC